VGQVLEVKAFLAKGTMVDLAELELLQTQLPLVAAAQEQLD